MSNSWQRHLGRLSWARFQTSPDFVRLVAGSNWHHLLWLCITTWAGGMHLPWSGLSSDKAELEGLACWTSQKEHIYSSKDCMCHCVFTIAQYDPHAHAHQCTQAAYLNVPHCFQCIIPTITLPEAQAWESGGRWFQLSHQVDDGHVAFVISLAGPCTSLLSLCLRRSCLQGRTFCRLWMLWSTWHQPTTSSTGCRGTGMTRSSTRDGTRCGWHSRLTNMFVETFETKNWATRLWQQRKSFKTTTMQTRRHMHLQVCQRCGDVWWITTPHPTVAPNNLFPLMQVRLPTLWSRQIANNSNKPLHVPGVVMARTVMSGEEVALQHCAQKSLSRSQTIYFSNKESYSALCSK